MNFFGKTQAVAALFSKRTSTPAENESATVTANQRDSHRPDPRGELLLVNVVTTDA